MRKLLLMILALAVTASLVPAAARAKDARATDEQAIRAESEAWARAGAAKDVEKFVSYYAPDATLFPPNAPKVSGKEPILAYWKQFFAAPGLAATITTDRVEVARSGDLAFETGAYTVTADDVHGMPMTEAGKYVVVWKKQPNGKWKAVADIFNPDK